MRKTKRRKQFYDVFVVISGSMINNLDALDWIALLAEDFKVTVCVGGGQQINDYFKKNNLPVEFCPVGRICRTTEQKKIATKILRQNRKAVKRQLKTRKAKVKLILPLMKIGKKICHVNTDIMALNAYVEYDEIFIITIRQKVQQKKDWQKKLVEIFSTEMTELKNLDKFQIYSN